MIPLLGQSAAAIAVTAATIASYLPFPFVGNIGDLALYALGEQSGEATAAAIALGIVPGGKLLKKLGLGKAAGFLSRLGASAWKSAKYYAGNFARAAVRFGTKYSGLNLLGRAANFLLKRKPGSLCGCFAAGTMVWTASGQVPIQDVSVGDFVVAQDEQSGLTIFGQVGTEIVTHDAALVELQLLHQSGRSEVLETTDEHPFAVMDSEAKYGTQWTRVDGLAPGYRIKTLAGYATVTELRFTDRRTTVYNFSVFDTPTYFVGDEGTLVHNCSPFAKRNRKLAGMNHPVTNVPFDLFGYPNFKDWMTHETYLPAGHAGRRVDSMAANKHFDFDETPAGYTWHHHQDGNTMQLVPTDVHKKTGHTGSRPGR